MDRLLLQNVLTVKHLKVVCWQKRYGEFAAIIALKCETDFVAKNADFVALTQAILDAAVANRCKTLEEVKALPMGNGTVQDAVTDRSGITGEKMELDGYNVVEGAYTSIYKPPGEITSFVLLLP